MITDQKLLLELHQIQKESLDEYFDHLDLEQAENTVDLLASCKGIIFFTGIGKSGIIADKIAKTLSSIGTKALFLDPLGALHGDMGLLERQDQLVILSKSGEGRELELFIHYAKERGLVCHLWTAQKQSPLIALVDMHMILPQGKELCPFNLAPTISATVQLLFGDLISIAMMRKKAFALDEYAKNHPAGRIGKKIATKVRHVMLTGKAVPKISSNITVREALLELSSKRCGCVVVCDNRDRAIGLFTDGDLRRLVTTSRSNFFFDEPIENYATQNFLFCSPELLAMEAVEYMQNNPKGRVLILPVIDQDKLVGLVTLHDLINK